MLAGNFEILSTLSLAAVDRLKFFFFSWTFFSKFVWAETLLSLFVTANGTVKYFHKLLKTSISGEIFIMTYLIVSVEVEFHHHHVAILIDELIHYADELFNHLFVYLFSEFVFKLT